MKSSKKKDGWTEEDIGIALRAADAMKAAHDAGELVESRFYKPAADSELRGLWLFIGDRCAEEDDSSLWTLVWDRYRELKIEILDFALDGGEG